MPSLKHIFKLFFVLCLLGCETVKQDEEKNTNAILENTDFQDFLKQSAITVVAPSTFVGQESFSTLKSLFEQHMISFTQSFSGKVPYHAGSDAQRLAALKEGIYNADSQIIWSLRGGYGSGRLIEGLLKEPKPTNKKMFIGYSDSTALHLFFSQEWNWVTLHGAVFREVLDAGKDPKNFKNLMDVISTEKPWSIKNLQPLNAPARKADTLEGKLTGGNLTLLENSIGTKWQLQAQEKILFIEDVGAKDYQIDRSLYHLREAGLLKGVKAIIFGDFCQVRGNKLFSLRRFANHIDIPVFKTNQFGHGKRNIPIPYNGIGTLSKKWHSLGHNLEMKIYN